MNRLGTFPDSRRDTLRKLLDRVGAKYVGEVRSSKKAAGA